MRYTKTAYGNCVFAVFWLCLRRNVCSVLCFSSRSKAWPYHFVCTKDSGRCYQFYHVLPHRLNKWAPWWFLGRLEIFESKEEVIERLAKSKRHLLHEVPPWAVLIPCSIVWAILFVPYMVGFALYPVCWWLAGLIDSFKRKR